MPENVLPFSIAYFSQLNECSNANKTVTLPPSPTVSSRPQVVVNEEAEVITPRTPTPGSDEDEEDEEEDEPPPFPADYRRKSVYTKGYNPDDEDDEDEGKSEFGKFPKTTEMKNKLEDSIKHNLLFRGLEPEQMITIVDAMKEVPVRIGDEIIKQGDDGDYFYVIESGSFDVFVTCDNQEEKLIRTYDNSGCFGELALMYNQPRSATVKATSNGLIFSLDRNAFQKIVVKSAHERRKLHEELIGKVSLFQGLTDVEKLTIADVLQSMTFSDDERIINEGDAADGMYFVISGSVRVSQRQGLMEHVVKTVKAGEYFGELALLDNKPRAANCYAIGPTKLAFLSAEAFERLMGPCLELMQRQAAQYSK